MSTKASITLVEGIHLYQECFDEEHVYLEFGKCAFEAQFTSDSAQISVAIPLHVWEFLRTLPGGNYHLVDKTDEELRAEVTQEVDERINRWKETGKQESLACGLYGSESDPRDQQIRRGLDEMIRRRTVQREILAKAQRLVEEHRPEHHS